MSGRYCVVIPAYNAEQTIGEVVRAIKHQGLQVVVIDDGSRDRTAAIASAQGALVISHLSNQGKGNALRTGFDYVLRSDYDGAITMDSDGQHDPTDIPHLIREGEVQHAGIAIGNRLANGAPMPRLRRWTNHFMSSIVSAVARQRIPDSQCGFRFIRKELLRDVPFKTARFDSETEMLFGAAAKRWKIISVPIRTIYRDERSHIRPLRDGLRFARLILRHLARR